MGIVSSRRSSAALMACFLAGCCFVHPTWTASEAVGHARRYAAEKRIDLAEYEEPDVRFDSRLRYGGHRGFWAVSFWPKSRVIGADFMLLIREHTGEVVYVAGY